ncbi:homogentisate 1,2-dioxygenase [Paraferrimonas sedimenticola]|uniref:Homogentisate 1,2-dioxygenase n=1 Tax=Paraferrimonas sedimenticola TaxID=375674 RepID=A0AA37RZN6_9GAMM|nr:homogentisate 1,2-dioxygenase [Paraferrimonas sedimenticola]GLP97567.1 homogentisate 1,2-dioxygenase [Paraferrimonas sedimenticola]
MSFQYLSGFDNEHQTEALPGALPQGQFSPQTLKYGLYAEQINSTAFTAPRADNRRSWLYRIRPSVVMGKFRHLEQDKWQTAPIDSERFPPDPMRWDPLPTIDDDVHFIEGMTTIAGNGDAASQTGFGIHYYQANVAMGDEYFYNADGELLIVPQQNSLLALTEMGRLQVAPGEILVIPRGVKFQINPVEGPIRGYIAENYGAPLQLPERGPVGANGYANDRDFLYPTAWYQDVEGDFTLTAKFAGELYQADMSHCPLDVVAWTGNSAPYKYDLSRFNAMNTVTFDHPDPSIFTVLTSPTNTPGTASLDFVIFPPRWMVAENTFRPPWYHRNMMSEFMGLIHGVYDAKETGFVPGGMSLHNCMTPHGPDAEVFAKASSAELAPQRYQDTLAFMFESCFPIRPTDYALASPSLQRDYSDCWQTLGKHFDANEQ